MDFKVPTTQGKTDSLEDWGQTNSRFINLVIDDQGAIHARPGLATISGLTTKTSGTSQNIIGSQVWRNPVDLQTYFVYVRADRWIRALNLTTLVTTDLSDGTVTTLLDGSGTRAIFSQDTIRLVIAGGGQLQQWSGSGLSDRLDPVATWSATTNQPPIGATHVAFLGNYLFANNYTPGGYGQFLWSNLGDGNHRVWNPLNFNTADASPDRVTGTYASLRELFVFGEESLQVYGIADDPLLPVNTAATLSIGCGAPYSPVLLEDRFAWVDDQRRIVSSDGRSFEVLSTSVAQTLRTMSTVADAWGFRVRVSFYDFLVWVFPAAQVTLTYDLKTKAWGTWETLGSLGVPVNPRIGSVSYWAANNNTYVGDSSYENVWLLDPTATVDLGSTPIDCSLMTNRDDYGTPRFKRTSWVTLYIKRGQSPQGGSLEVSVRDDDRPWRPWKSISVGTPGDYKSSRTWYPGGVFQRRQYWIRYSASADMALSGVIETYELMQR